MKRLTPLLFLLAAVLASCEAQPVYAQKAPPGRTMIYAAGKPGPVLICSHYAHQCRLQPGRSLDEAVATMFDLVRQAQEEYAPIETRKAARLRFAAWHPKPPVFAQAAPAKVPASKPVAEAEGKNAEAPKPEAQSPKPSLPPVLTDGQHEAARLRLREPQLLFFSAQKDLQLAASQFYAVCTQLTQEEKWPSGTRCDLNTLAVVFPASPELKPAGKPSALSPQPSAKPPAQ